MTASVVRSPRAGDEWRRGDRTVVVSFVCDWEYCQAFPGGAQHVHVWDPGTTDAAAYAADWFASAWELVERGKAS